MKRTAIIGLGITGLSCLRYLDGRDELLVLDTRPRPPNGAVAQRDFPDTQFHFGAERFEHDGVDRVIVSPGVALESCLVQGARAAGIELVSDIDLFCEAARAPITAITGTNGKSTVTSLVGHFLRAMGRSPGVGGNLGEPALDLLDDNADNYVIELSSFQLERLGRHRFNAATILNISEDHLDRHGDMAAYRASKQRIYRDCRLAVANRLDPQTLPDGDVERLVTFGLDTPREGDFGIVEDRLVGAGGDLLPIGELLIAGRHNALNVLAALALVCETFPDSRKLADAARSFAGLPHRCQRVAVVEGVSYVNDSKATNVGATIAALEGLGDPSRRNLILIAGGEGKGADFSPLREVVGRYVKHAILIGVDADAIERALQKVTPVTRAESLMQAVSAARDKARNGDLVLLSPACASFDMFDNFSHRGECFAAAVQGLAT